MSAESNFMAENEEVNTIADDGDSGNSSEVENLKKQLKDAQSKIGEQAEQLKVAQGYIREANELGELILENEDLKSNVQKAWNKKYGRYADDDKQKNKGSDQKKDTGVEDAKIKEYDERIKGVETTTRKATIKNIEDRLGLSQMSAEERKEARTKIGEYLADFGQSVSDVPLEKLDTVMEKAYKAVNLEQAAEEGNLKTMAQQYTNLSGAVGGLKSRNIDEEEAESDLTPEQKKWAEKFGVDKGKAKELKDTISIKK